MGRCIRHKNDYGAIILMDERYSKVQNQKSLSRWYAHLLQRSIALMLDSYNRFVTVFYKLGWERSRVITGLAHHSSSESSRT
jgi:hypothetical protein